MEKFGGQTLRKYVKCRGTLKVGYRWRDYFSSLISKKECFTFFFFFHCWYTSLCTVSLAWLKSADMAYSSKEMSMLSDSRSDWLAITKILLIAETYALAAISRIKYPQGIWLKASIQVWHTACKNISSLSCSTTVHYA